MFLFLSTPTFCSHFSTSNKFRNSDFLGLKTVLKDRYNLNTPAKMKICRFVNQSVSINCNVHRTPVPYSYMEGVRYSYIAEGKLNCFRTSPPWTSNGKQEYLILCSKLQYKGCLKISQIRKHSKINNIQLGICE